MSHSAAFTETFVEHRGHLGQCMHGMLACCSHSFNRIRDRCIVSIFGERGVSAEQQDTIGSLALPAGVKTGQQSRAGSVKPPHTAQPVSHTAGVRPAGAAQPECAQGSD